MSSIICVRSIPPHTDRTVRWHWYEALENNFQQVHRLLGRQLLHGGTSPAPSLTPRSASPTFPRSNSDPALNGNDHDPFCVAELRACFTLSYYPLKMLARCKNVGNIQGNNCYSKKKKKSGTPGNTPLMKDETSSLTSATSQSYRPQTLFPMTVYAAGSVWGLGSLHTSLHDSCMLPCMEAGRLFFSRLLNAFLY